MREFYRAPGLFRGTIGVQILTYLRMSGIRLGFLTNSHAAKLKDGLKRFII
jgi:hypothetical protein